ncbi:MAG: phosphoribosylformylglycinamidine synthase subunit PurL [Nitrospinota bacterium]
MTDESVTLKTALEHNLTEGEFELIQKLMGRVPNRLELGIFSAMWSEHCSYKSSRVHLKRFHTTGERVIQGPGENAGIIDIGGGLAVVFKMESHNHPSYIEPVQGAATGVGGILRDVFTMGARPIASFDSLCFGEPKNERTAYLLKGVVKGISSYGNCIGVPTVGGSTRFHECYNGNNLVNAMTLGIVKTDYIFLGSASGVGNKVIYIGSKTGRDGIHGAVMASDTFDEDSEEKRPTVQVGDPFTEKLLLEACLELFAESVVEGIQDMGAAGLTSSSFEMASRGESGLKIHLDRVPVREEGMTPYELMLSESQERMLLVAKPENEARILEILDKWDLEAAVIGEVEDRDRVKLYFNGKQVGDMPVSALVDEAPMLERPMKEPEYLAKTSAFDPLSVTEPDDLQSVFFKLLSSPNLNGKKWITEQYDSMVGINTVTGPGSDAAVVRVKGTTKAIAVSTGCNERYCYLDPETGGAIAVAEAARNVACMGALPIGATDCLNFGSPENPEIMWQFAKAVDGITLACRELDVPIVSGNVSLYNQTGDAAIFPTPMIGVVGLIDDLEKTVPSFFQNEGDVIFLLGRTKSETGGSEYLKTIHGHDAGKPPAIDLKKEKTLIETLLELSDKKIISSAHDLSEGGLAQALAECSLSGGGLGCEVDMDSNTRGDVLLFSESQSRALVTITPFAMKDLRPVLDSKKIPWKPIGRVKAQEFSIRVNGAPLIDTTVADLETVYHDALEKGIFGE